MKKRVLSILAAFVIVFSNVAAAGAALKDTDGIIKEKKNTASAKKKLVEWPDGPDPASLSSDSAIVMELSSGLVLYEHKAHKKHYPASITKIMTTLLCLENSSLSETVTYSQEAVYGIEAGSSNMWIAVGEKMTMEQSLYCIMLESANEACLGVAEHIAGSVDKFVDMMNERVEQLGLKGTHFQNPNGLHDDNHYTTAYDMAVISQEAMKNSIFRKLTGSKTYTVPKTNKNDARAMRNHQQLLYGYDYPQYTYKYCTGGKTGYTSMAGATLVTFAEKDGMELVCVTMAGKSGKQGEPNEFTDSIKLLNYAFENFRKYTIDNSDEEEEEDSVLFSTYNALFDKDSSPVHMSEDAGVILPKGARLKDAEKTISYNQDVELQEGENVIGTIEYTYNGKMVGQASVIYDKKETQKLDAQAGDSVSGIIEDLKANETKNAAKKKFSIKKLLPSNWKIKAVQIKSFHLSAKGVRTFIKAAAIIAGVLILAGAVLFVYKRKRRRGVHFHRRHNRTWESFNKSLADFKLDK